MFEALRQFIQQTRGGLPAASSPAPRHDDSQLAACALLIELAQADGEFSPEERGHIEAAVGRHFGLEPAAVHELLVLAEAERNRSIDHFQFTRVIRDRFDLGQRMVLAEVMWGVVLADGKIGDHEGYLLRKLGHLLDLAPGYLATARHAAVSATSPPETP
jgi:uncharacterized tellurite resistance protein B-like protein